MDERIDIAGVIGALAVHVDAQRWSALALLFAPAVRVDYSSLFGGEAQSLPREQLLAGWQQLLPGFTHTCHVIGTPHITASGITASSGTARAEASVIATHWISLPSLAGKDRWTVGGCYDFGFRKLEGSWRIDNLTLARAWQDGNPDLPRLARERAAGSPSSA
ncbi:MAG TPA: nuclear transport factor 2 family protein [Steroidobacteraceae bacterium]|nr:nuclear transport factor 2 family protein [Steroidobacteraceae bacterium]